MLIQNLELKELLVNYKHSLIGTGADRKNGVQQIKK